MTRKHNLTVFYTVLKILLGANKTRYIIANINRYLDVGFFEVFVIYSIWNQTFLIPNEYLLI